LLSVELGAGVGGVDVAAIMGKFCIAGRLQ
jgi:hypothetical protein